MILLIDNYDSFVFNLARYLHRLGQETQVVRNDAIDVSGVRDLAPQALLLSPGPCTPKEAGCSLEIVRAFCGVLPILGVCLGHQAIAAALGGVIVRAPQPMHGRTSPMFHNGRGLFAGIPSPATVCRYHSLMVDRASLPDCLEILAHTDDGVVMAFQHRQAPVVGVQFHPEAILTEHGYELLGNFLRLAGLSPTPVPNFDSEIAPAKPHHFAPPSSPVTF